MIKSRLYEYDSTKADNGYRGEEYTKYILVGNVSNDELNLTLETAELTLAGLPSRRNNDVKTEEFAPKTKFILDYEDDSVLDPNGNPYTETHHLIVQEDVVEKPILSDDNYYNHHMSLIEASAIAQGRLVDNISVTYRLQDVSLDSQAIFNTDLNATVKHENAVPNANAGHFKDNQFYINNNASLTRQEYCLGKKMEWNMPNQWQEFKYYQPTPRSGVQRSVTLNIPMLKIFNGMENGTYSPLGYCSVLTTVTEKNNKTGELRVVSETITNPSRQAQEEIWHYDNEWAMNRFPSIEDKEGRIVSSLEYYVANPVPLAVINYNTKTTKVAEYVNAVENRTVTFNLNPDCTYTVYTCLKNNFAYYSMGSAENYIVWTDIKNNNPTFYTNNGYPFAKLVFMTYVEADTNNMLFKSAPPANAYDLFQKAQISTQNIDKQEGIAIDETQQTFYVSDADKLMLQNTQIIENFYNQKNLWELFVEIGKYIHSIPKIKFGDENHPDQFLVEWRKLGATNQYENNATPISIFNSRSLENYVSACSSYVTNLVQLGGVIEEWVAPKSSSEDYLVYNDVAEIQTSKPIIEIVSLEAKCINNTYGIDPSQTTQTLTPENEAGYVFEENVYNVLGINWSLKTNKGFAIYYTLGDNKIVGLQYQLPTASAGDYEGNYAIKNILGRIFRIGNTGDTENPNLWANIKVNDFLFHIVYRTKDTARSDQTRPDLRKYLLGSNYDKVPQHNQFNNQQDVLVDGNKFGNNIYGKLIRTGNTEYTVVDWIDTLTALKHVGELYKINNELYYVSSVRTTNYGTNLVSETIFTKDYNQLSEIIGIPSEPRFYEISEQSLIEREVAIDDYLVVGTKYPELSYGSRSHYVRENGWHYINALLFQNQKEFPKYAITVFKNDIDKRTNDDLQGNETFFKEVCHPINTYSIQNSLTMEWDMVDNFSAGDKVEDTNETVSGTIDTAYNTLNPVKYTDVYGRSDLIDFVVVSDLGELAPSWIKALPDSPVRTRFHAIKNYIGKMELDGIPSVQWFFDTLTAFVGVPVNGDGVLVNFTNADLTYLVYYKDGTWIDYTTHQQWTITTPQLDAYEVQLVDTNVIYYEGTPIYYESDIQGYGYKLKTNNGSINWGAKTITDYNSKYLFGNDMLAELGTNERGLGLLKDNREKIDLNVNIQMLTDSDCFVLSSWLWQPAKGNLRLALLDTEINKISNDTILNDNIISDEYIIYSQDTQNTQVTADDTNGHITINIRNLLQDLTDEQMENVKALAIVSDEIVAGNTTSGARYFVMGRNVSDLTADEKKQTWYIYNYDKAMFPHQ